MQESHSLCLPSMVPASLLRVSLHYRLCNYGTNPLTSATIELKSGSTVLQTTNWTGTLQTYESAYLAFTGIPGNPGFQQCRCCASIRMDKLIRMLPTTVQHNRIWFIFPLADPVTEDYSGSTFPPANWFNLNGGNQNAGWSQSTAGYSAGGSAKMDFFNSPSGDVDALLLLLLICRPTTMLCNQFLCFRRAIWNFQWQY